jgi:hypothetical protein
MHVSFPSIKVESPDIPVHMNLALTPILSLDFISAELARIAHANFFNR